MTLMIYRSLLQHFGPQNWWPASGGFQPREWEICIGAILTQNTSWKNVEKALDNLRKVKLLAPENIARMHSNKLANLIKPSGYFRQKAKHLKEFARFVSSYRSFKQFMNEITREQLLSVSGIGRETADSILLYACNKPFFVVDAYTRRIFSRVGMVDEKADYDKIRHFAEKAVAKEKNEDTVKIFNEYHALLVALGKIICTKNEPRCIECPIGSYCRHGAKILGKPGPSHAYHEFPAVREQHA